MLAIYASLTRLFRTAEQKVKVAAHNAGDKARVKANSAFHALHDTADTMRKEADDLEVRAKNNFKDALNRIDATLAGI